MTSEILKYLRWFLGLRKLRPSKKLKFCKSYLFCELHHEKWIFYYGGKKGRSFLICIMELFSAALSYLNALSTLNFSRNFFYVKAWTQIIKEARFEFYKEQPFISGTGVVKDSGSTLSGPPISFTGVFEDFRHIFLACSKNSTKILKLGKIIRCVTSLWLLFRKWQNVLP